MLMAMLFASALKFHLPDSGQLPHPAKWLCAPCLRQQQQQQRPFAERFRTNKCYF